MRRSGARTPRTLAEALADCAEQLRRAVVGALRRPDERGPIRSFEAALQVELARDPRGAELADTVAQTLCLGLLTARWLSSEGPASRYEPFTRGRALALLATTSPLLGGLFEALRVGTLPSLDRPLDAAVDLLDHTDLMDIFGGGEKTPADPVFGFYDLFLAAYDAATRRARGAYDTPRPVVSFIVRSVDEVLRDEFGLVDGLADTATWGDVVRRHPGVSMPSGANAETGFVQILDPATGTGAFIVAAIDLIHETLRERWCREGVPEGMRRRRWTDYVRRHLLPRLHAFELMPSPYAVAHLKVAVKLLETGYRPRPSDRLHLYRTNALEPPREGAGRRETFAQAADRIKATVPFTVIIGNPPYALRSGNLLPQHRALILPYKRVADGALRERGALQLEKILNDDYVKFFARAEQLVRRSGLGVVGLVTNHAFLDNPTMRGMRRHLLDTFSSAHFWDLAGSAKRARPRVDENLFAIRQGVAVSILRRAPASRGHAFRRSSGRREDKCRELDRASLRDGRWVPLSPAPPLHGFVPVDASCARAAEYEAMISVASVFGLRSIGLFTSKDRLVIDRDKDALVTRIQAFRASKLSDEALCRSVDVRAKKAWNVARSRAELGALADVAGPVRSFAHRPFDRKYIFYHRSLVWSMAFPVNRHMLSGRNLALVTSRQLAAPPWRHAFCASQIVEMFYITNRTKEGLHVFPLYLEADAEAGRRHNIDEAFLSELAAGLGLRPLPLGSGRPASTLGPEDVFSYVYAVLNCPAYRARYEPLLAQDFPRVPRIANPSLFWELCAAGAALARCHLLSERDDPATERAVLGKHPAVELVGDDRRIGRGFPRYDPGAQRAYIGPSTWFEPIPPDVWAFHAGAYALCQKWLRDRARTSADGGFLQDADVHRYRILVAVVRETLALMASIDAAVDGRGGWPSAFQGKA